MEGARAAPLPSTEYTTGTIVKTKQIRLYTEQFNKGETLCQFLCVLSSQQERRSKWIDPSE